MNKFKKRIFVWCLSLSFIIGLSLNEVNSQSTVEGTSEFVEDVVEGSNGYGSGTLTTAKCYHKAEDTGSSHINFCKNGTCTYMGQVTGSNFGKCK